MVNYNLSDMLLTIYDNHFCEPSNSITKGALSDICCYSKEKISVSDLSKNKYYSTENMLPEKAGAVDATSLPSILQTTKCKIGDVLISNIRPYFKKIMYVWAECGCSTDVLCFSPKSDNLSAYLFCTLYKDQFFNFMVAGSKGTKMPRGDKQQIMTYNISIPSCKELDRFNCIAIPILTQIEENRKQNVELTSLRNTLLPDLISGKIDVDKILI